MKIGDLVIWKGSWGIVDHIYEISDACSVEIGKSRKRVVTWLDIVQEAKEIEVHSGVWLKKDELNSISRLKNDAQINLLSYFVKKYKINPPRAVGFGLTNCGQIVYTQVVPKV